jgi:hypothetical protein
LTLNIHNFEVPQTIHSHNHRSFKNSTKSSQEIKRGIYIQISNDFSKNLCTSVLKSTRSKHNAYMHRPMNMTRSRNPKIVQNQKAESTVEEIQQRSGRIQGKHALIRDLQSSMTRISPPWHRVGHRARRSAVLRPWGEDGVAGDHRWESSGGA